MFFWWQHPLLKFTGAFFRIFWGEQVFFVISKEFIFRTAFFIWCICCLYDHARSSARIIWLCNFWCLKNCTKKPFNCSLIFLWSRYFNTINILLLYIYSVSIWRMPKSYVDVWSNGVFVINDDKNGSLWWQYWASQLFVAIAQTAMVRVYFKNILRNIVCVFPKKVDICDLTWVFISF